MANASQIASAGVYVTDDVGVEVTDGSHSRVQLGLLPGGTYGLRVVASNGSTVIIDGTSDMFRIAATGTLDQPAGASPENVSSNITTGLLYAPANMSFYNVFGQVVARPIPVMFNGGAVNSSFDVACSANGDGTTNVSYNFWWTIANQHNQITYYLLVQTAL